MAMHKIQIHAALVPDAAFRYNNKNFESE